MPIRVQPGRSRLARCSGLASHSPMIDEDWAYVPLPQARFSPAAGPCTWNETMRPWKSPCVKTLARSISDEWERAARTRVESTRSGLRPCAARVWLTACRRLVTARWVVPAPAAGARTNPLKTTAKTMRICFFPNTILTFASESDGVSPPFGGTRRCLSPRRLRQADPGQDDRGAGQLGRGERFPEPGPGDDRRHDRLEHRGDAGSGRRDVAERADDERERHDRAEDDDPEHERPHGDVHAGERPLQ